MTTPAEWSTGGARDRRRNAQHPGRTRNRGSRPSLGAAALVLCCLALTACGFQLRGTGGGSALPDAWRSMHLATANPNAEIARVVNATFSASGIEWSDRATANYQLNLGPERFSRRNLSVNAQARAAEFDLVMRAEFSVLDPQGKVVMPLTTATVNKQMENDPQNVVGKAEEVRILRSELRRELAAQILRRISFFAASAG